MILVDERVGSRHYADLIGRDSIRCRLDSADLAFATFTGQGVGLEVKKVNDAINSMFSGRLADLQLPKMVEMFDVRYLIIEGMYRGDPENGVMQIWREFGSKRGVECGRWYDAHRWEGSKKRLMYSQFEQWLHTVSLETGTILEKTLSEHGTAQLARTLYNWHQKSRHRSLHVMMEPQGEGASVIRPSTLRRIAAQLPMVGWERSAAVVKKFHSVRKMLLAPEEAWMEIEGIGKGIARKVVEAVEEEVSW